MTQPPRPAMFEEEYAGIFKDASVVAAYRHRPPYPPETFAKLDALFPEDCARTVLDVGCGTGFVARELVARVERIDAIDYSANMIEAARRLPGGDDPRIRWICAPVEEAPFEGPYAMVTAGASLHWLEWGVVLPRFREALAPAGCLVMVGDGVEAAPWDEEARPIFARYSMNRSFTPYDTFTICEELETRGLFRREGAERTDSVPWVQPVDEYIESFHARNGLSRDRMGDSARLFDEELREVVLRYLPAETVELRVFGQLLWGTPL